MDSQEGYYLQLPNRIWNFKPDFCPKDGKYGSLGICSFFPAQKNAPVKVCGSALYDPWSKLYKKFFDKLVGNEREGGREAGKCSKMVSDRGGRCLCFF
jgi:hypothetical protein